MQPDAVAVPYYTMPELIMLISAVGALLTGVIAALASAIVSVRTNTTVKHNSEQLNRNTEMTQAALTKVTVVEGHVNSERSKLDEQLASAQREKELLRSELTQRNQTAAVLAHVSAQAVGMRQSDPNAPHDRRAEDKVKPIETEDEPG